MTEDATATWNENLTWGVEIEFAGDKQAVLSAFRAAGINYVDSTHTHNTGTAPLGWAVKRDGSVMNGGEVTSPILKWTEEHVAEMHAIVKLMREAGATTSPQCGIHIHIGANHENGSLMNGKEVGAVVRWCHKFEDAIYRIASSGWENLRPGARTYAKPIPLEIAALIMNSVDTISDLGRVWDTNPVGTRYTACNLQSFFDRQTVEFRYFNASLNGQRIECYAALCMAIVQDAKNGYRRQVKTHYPLGSMRDGIVSEDKLLLRLQQVLTTNGNDSKRTMSKAHWKLFRKFWAKDSKPQRNIFNGRTALTGRAAQRSLVSS